MSKNPFHSDQAQDDAVGCIREAFARTYDVIDARLVPGPHATDIRDQLLQTFLDAVYTIGVDGVVSETPVLPPPAEIPAAPEPRGPFSRDPWLFFSRDPWLFFSSAQIAKATGSSIEAIEVNWPHVAYALGDVGIRSKLCDIAAIATIRVEVGAGFAPIPEYASGTDYNGRADLGNTEPGDGPRFKGRGYIQITGRSNYKHYSEKVGLDLTGDPDKALDPSVAARILAAYFFDIHVDTAAVDRDWVAVRRKVNGGTNGYDVFSKVVEAMLHIDE